MAKKHGEKNTHEQNTARKNIPPQRRTRKNASHAKVTKESSHREARPKRKDHPGRRGLLVALVTYVGIMVIILLAMAPRQYDLAVGDVAPETIKATKDVVDQVSTQAAQDRAAAQVDSVFNLRSDINELILMKLETAFNTLEDIRVSGETERGMRNGFNVPDGAPMVTPTPKPDFSETFLTGMEALLPDRLTRSDLLLVLKTGKDELEALRVATLQAVTKELDEGIKNGTEKDYVGERLVNIAEDLRNYYPPQLSVALQRIGNLLAGNYLEPNLIYDEEATEAKRETARANVQPLIYKKDQKVIGESEILTEAQMQVLVALGLLTDKNGDVRLYIGMGLLVLVLIALVGLYIKIFDPKWLAEWNSLWLISVITLMVLLLCWATVRISPNLMPVALGPLLIALMLSPRLGVVVGVALSILAGMITGAQTGNTDWSTVTVLITSLTAGTAGAFLVFRMQQRNSVLVVGLLTGLINVVVLGGLEAMRVHEYQQILFTCLWGLLNGVATTVFCLGTLPFWELLFNVVTPFKLMELANPNQPLMKRLQMEAPGTYHHSLIVANLSERAADTLGINSLLVRVGAYYHDVGKLRRPYFFRENQMGDNPHDRLPPEASASVLIAHPKDGAQLARQNKLPQAVIDFIEQHHGTSLASYFYYKAKEQAQGAEIDTAPYRYPGPNPSTREVGIVMMADSVEAAVRAMKQPTPEKIDQLVHQLIHAMVEQGRCEDCELTLRDIKKIGDTFTEVLTGVYHERIEYPAEVLKSATTGDPQMTLRNDDRKAERAAADQAALIMTDAPSANVAEPPDVDMQPVVTESGEGTV